MSKVKLTSQMGIFIALISLFVVSVASYLKNINFSPTSLQVVINSPTGPDPFYGGDVLALNYHSRYANLGAIEIRFNTYDRINSDSLEFRIKEQGKSDWDYRAEYRVDQFQNNKLFPFGFPIINESENRTYRIEVESQRGVSGDSVAQSGISPRVVSRHVFGRKLLFSDPRLLFRFAIQKAANLIRFQEFFSSLVLFATPLISYLVYLIIGSGVGLFSSALFVLTVVDIFWVRRYYPYFQLSVVFAWLLVMRKHRLTHLVPAFIGMLLFTLVPLPHFFGFETIANKLGTWAFWFFCLAVFQMGYELFTRFGQATTLQQYRKRVFIEVWNTLVIAWLMAVGQVILMAETSRIHSGRVTPGKRLSTKEFSHQVTLIVNRLGVPMIRTYLLTSRFIAFLIQTLIGSLNYAFRFGPYLVSVWLIGFSVRRLSGYADFFQSFFITDQPNRFWNSVGYYQVVVYLSAAVIFSISQRKKALRVKIYYLIAVLLITLNLSHAVFDFATISYRDKPTIWVARPEQTAEPWVDVTIVGRNFGEKPFRGRVYIDGVEQRIIDWRTDEIIFRTNPVTTKTGNLSIKTRRGEPSNDIVFTYTGNR